MRMLRRDKRSGTEDAEGAVWRRIVWIPEGRAESCDSVSTAFSFSEESKKMLHEFMNGAVIPFTFPRSKGIEKGKCFAIDVEISAKVF